MQSSNSPLVLTNGKIDIMQQAAFTVHSFSRDMLRIKSSTEHLILLVKSPNKELKTMMVTGLQKLIDDMNKLQGLLVESNVDVLGMVRQRLISLHDNYLPSNSFILLISPCFVP